MVQKEKVLQAISKAQGFLENTQQPDGSWAEETKRKEPEHLQGSLVSTSQGLQTLAYLASPETLPAVNKALYFCLSKELFDKDPIDLWAWKLLALRFFDTLLYRKLRRQMTKYIGKQQTARGCWRCFPSTSNLTNFYAILATEDSKNPKVFEKASNWFRKTKAADGLGWGYNEEAQKSEISFTANAILSLLISGESPLDKNLQTAISFLEKKQMDDGGWPSSSLTVSNKSTVYATALVLWCLMRLSENSFNPLVEKGVRFLLGVQLPDGGWPLVPEEEKTSRYYTTYYAARVLSFYAFLKNQFEKKEIESLKQGLAQPQLLTAYLARRFERAARDKFQKAIRTHVLDSRVLGSTPKAVMRRKEILRILGEQGEKYVADIIDELKKLPQYADLSKKSHMTQIKADVNYLKSLNIISETDDYKYYATLAIF